MQEFIVSNLEDENDGDFSTGDLSLREAISQAESGDAISFSSNLSESTINLSLGELVIDKNLTVNGLGSDQLTIDAGGKSRVFNIDDGNKENLLEVAIDGLAIANGSASNTNTFVGARGGGIFTQENLELTNSLISSNSAISAGAGIYSSGEQLNISNSTITDNSASFTRGVGQGGGINTVGTTVEITNSQITNNGSANGGGGIDVSDSNITIVGSEISDNSGLRAGGIASEKSTVNVSTSSINNNDTGVFSGSGAIDSDSDSVLTIDRSTIDSNSGIDPFNPFPPRGSQAFAAGIGARGTTTISNSTISNSTVTRIDNPVPADDPRGDIPESVIGFGVRNTGNLNVVNSTFAGNEDGGFSNEDGTVNISNTTIADGVANIDLTGDPNATVTSTIIADDSQAEEVIDANQNLIGSSDALNLGELQDNGGATQTIALAEGSQAIDTGSNPNNLATDQRGEGFDRTIGAGTDIGAFEVQDASTIPTTPETPNALVVSTLEDENDGDFSDGDLSLREAIAIANEQEGTDTISFAASLSGGTIGLTESIEDPRGLGTINADLSIADSVEINGLGANNLTLDGLNAGGGIFHIDGENTNVTVEGLNITNGSRKAFFFNDFKSGGAVRANKGSNFTLRDSIISNSSADNAGAISSGGSVEIRNSLITGNTSGGGRFPGGAVIVDGNLNVINSTVTQNTGTGITIGINNPGSANISNSTITDGISLINSDSTTITSSIVSRTNDESNAPSIISNSGQNITSGGNNLIGNGDGFTGFADSDLVGTGDNILDPLLGELQDNGGATSTIALLENSLAIDAGSNLQNLATDQRGEGFDRIVGNGTDIGAFELQSNDMPEVPTVEVPNVQPPEIEVPDIEVPNVQPPNVQPPEIEVPNVQPPDLGNLEGTEGNDHLSGKGTDDDVISGGAGHDTLDGNGGNDHILGGTGDDNIFGGAGDDLLDGNEGHNEISGENGHDTLYGGEGNDTLIGGSDNDLLVGAAGHDSLLGSNGLDVINGEAGDDFINGDGGDDLLTGGAGADTILGGAGHDVFVLESFDTHDVIVDFELGSDRLQLSDSLNFSQLNIVDNESNTGSLILDSNNNDAIIATVENVAAADLDVHVFS